MVGALAVDPETTLPAIIDRTRDVDPEVRQAAQGTGPLWCRCLLKRANCSVPHTREVRPLPGCDAWQW